MFLFAEQTESLAQHARILLLLFSLTKDTLTAFATAMEKKGKELIIPHIAA